MHTNIPIQSEPVTNTPDALLDSYRYCESLTRKRARNFYFGIRLTPKSKRNAMYALYAWTRLTDDLADDAPSPQIAKTQLDQFRERTNQAILHPTAEIQSSATTSTSFINSPIWPAFTQVIHQYHINPDDLTAMIEGQLDDLTTNIRDTFNNLHQYCDRVAATVGRSCLAIWGYQSDSPALQLAQDRGLALQLTNILRDFREDYQNGRIYLPQEDFNRFNLTPEQLLAWQQPDRCEQFMRFQTSRALSYYENSQPLESLISPDCIATSLGLMMIYRKLLDRIIENPQSITQLERIRISSFEKMKLALAAVQVARKYKQDQKATSTKGSTA